jgi:4-amino-4-deoxy-L-arabinose transferase-like glycosyltransferase
MRDTVPAVNEHAADASRQDAELQPAGTVSIRTSWRPLRFEVALVVLVSAAILVPGIWSYTLVDPWETHYGEVARTMLQHNDFVHTNWPGTSSGNPTDHEGFRSKPVLMFWMMAAGMRAVGVGEGGGYSGEMTDSVRVMIGIRLPFLACAIAGLAILWWMLARLVNRRLAWLALLVVGSTPMFCMIARNAIPDMPMVACTIGAVSLLLMAIEDGDRPISQFQLRLRGRPLRFDARHVVLGLAGGFVVAQAAYYAFYFASGPQLGARVALNPAVWLPLVMLWVLAGLHRDLWLLLLWRLPCVLVGGVIAAIVNEPMPRRQPGQSLWRHLFDDIIRPWERHALDRYLIRALPVTLAAGLAAAAVVVRLPTAVVLLGAAAIAGVAVIWWEVLRREGWAGTQRLADRLLGMAPITTMRQLFLLGCYFLLGVSVLAKGPPGLAVVALVGLLHLVCFWRWRALWDGGYELKRGLVLIFAVAFFWHVAMWLKEGPRFVQEYWQVHILNRAAAGVDNSPGTFEYYTDQIGHGMWLWAALLPAALASVMLRASHATREARVRFTIALWAIAAVTLFCIVQTKFHHYFLPAMPPLALLVAIFLDDVSARRDRLHPLAAALGIGIVLLLTRDLMFEPERWIEMFVFRYDRPWPNADPYAIDVSDPILGLGLAGAIAIAVLATRFARLGVLLVGATGLAICIWALQVYMPLAGTHWGMRSAVRSYYEQRTIYGEKQVYFGARQAAAAWQRAGDVHTFQSLLPDTLHLGQPMTLTVVVTKASDERIVEQEITLLGQVTEIRGRTIEVTLHEGERDQLAPIFAKAARHEAEAPVFERRLAELESKRAQAAGDQDKRAVQATIDKTRQQLAEVSLPRRRPVRAVDADRLIAWQLYWRGEQFWSGGEIWAFSPSQVLPEMKTSFVNTNNVEFQKYINDRTRAPVGRRYFIITEASRIMGVRSMLPTPRARDSFEVIDTTSNKFSIAAFYL